MSHGLPGEELKEISHHSHIKDGSPSQTPLPSLKSTSQKLNEIQELTFIMLGCCTTGHLLNFYKHAPIDANLNLKQQQQQHPEGQAQLSSANL